MSEKIFWECEMKIVFVSVVLFMGFVGCASKSHYGSYDQANRASQKAHMELQRDVK